jgi:hypothetical protein
MGRPKKRQRTENETDQEFAAHDMPLEESDDRASLRLQRNGQISSSEGISSTWNSGVPGLDMNSFDTAFTPDGTLQPWMLPTNVVDWDVSMPDHHGFDNNGIPSLTPDNSSSNSPPMLQFQPELQDAHGHYTHDNQLHPPTDTTPTTTQPPTCACLSTLYLTLSTLATMDPTFPFPTSLHPLREAMSTASQAITCPVCPTLFITGLQNVQLLNALLMSLAERFSRILASINAEANDLQVYNSKVSSPQELKTKTFRMADLSTPGHLHSGGPGCAAAFELSFTPAEWRSMAKKVVRAEVYGPADGSDECSPFLLGLITQMEERQERVHRAPPSFDHPRDRTGNAMSRTFEMGGGRVGGEGEREELGKGEHLCLKMLAGTRKMVDGLDWE